MTVLPLRHRRTPAPPINTTPNDCWGCWTPPGREHRLLACPAVTPARRHTALARPADARIFAGLLIGLPIGAALWAAAAAFIWSLT